MTNFGAILISTNIDIYDKASQSIDDNPLPAPILVSNTILWHKVSILMTLSNGNIYGVTGPQWIPLTKVSNAEMFPFE